LFDGVNLFGNPGHRLGSRAGAGWVMLPVSTEIKLSLPCVADQLVDDQAVLLNISSRLPFRRGTRAATVFFDETL